MLKSYVCFNWSLPVHYHSLPLGKGVNENEDRRKSLLQAWRIRQTIPSSVVRSSQPVETGEGRGHGEREISIRRRVLRARVLQRHLSVPLRKSWSLKMLQCAPEHPLLPIVRCPRLYIQSLTARNPVLKILI